MSTRLKHSIFRTTSLILLIALAAEIGVLGMLTHEWVRINSMATRERNQMQYLGVLSKLLHDWNAENGEQFFSLFRTESNSVATLYHRSMIESSLQNELQTGEQLFREDKQKLIGLQRMRTLMQSEKMAVNAIRLHANISFADPQGITLFARNYSHVLQIRRSLEELLAQQMSVLKDNELIDDLRYSEVQQLTYLCASLTIFAGLSFLIFMRLVDRRFRAVLLNAKALISQLPTMVNLSGSDEASYINTVIADTARQLKSIQEHRSSVLTMLIHDMRSPLMSAHIYVELLAEKAVEHNHECTRILEHIAEHLNSIVDSINEIITRAKSETLDTVISNPEPQASLQDPEPKLSGSHKKMTVQKKLWAVFLIPAAFQFLAFMYADRELDISKALVARERNLSNFLSSFTMSDLEMSRAVLYECGFLRTQQQKLRMLADQAIQRASDHLAIAAQSGQDDDRKLRLVSLQTAANRGTISTLRSFAPTMELTEFISKLADATEYTKSHTEGRILRLMHQDLFTEGFDELAAQVSRQHRYANNFSDELPLAVGLLISISLVSLLVMERHLQRRVRHVVGVAQKLGKEQKLADCLSGSDELAQLDSLLHQAYAALEIAKRERNHFALRLRDDLRRPLESLIGEFSTIAEAAAVDDGSISATDIEKPCGIGEFSTIAEPAAVDDGSISATDIEKSCEIGEFSTIAEPAAADDGSISATDIEKPCGIGEFSTIAEPAAVDDGSISATDIEKPCGIGEFSTIAEPAAVDDGSISAADIEKPCGILRQVVNLLDSISLIETLNAGEIKTCPNPISAKLLVSNSIKLVSSLAFAKSISLKNECAEDVLMVDDQQITQVLVNYLSNAIKFSPNDSTVEITSQPRGVLTRITVRDHGSGMTKEVQERVFDLYFQAEGENKSQGFGLGLAACKLIAVAHGGAVGVNSSVGSGSAFWIDLPACAQKLGPSG